MNNRATNIVKGVAIGMLIGMILEMLGLWISLIGSAALKWWYITIAIFLVLPFLWDGSWEISLYATATLFVAVVYCAAWAMFKECIQTSIVIYVVAFTLTYLMSFVPKPIGLDEVVARGFFSHSAHVTEAPTAPAYAAPKGTTGKPIIQFDSASLATLSR